MRLRFVAEIGHELGIEALLRLLVGETNQILVADFARDIEDRVRIERGGVAVRRRRGGYFRLDANRRRPVPLLGLFRLDPAFQFLLPRTRFFGLAPEPLAEVHFTLAVPALFVI